MVLAFDCALFPFLPPDRAIPRPAGNRAGWLKMISSVMFCLVCHCSACGADEHWWPFLPLAPVTKEEGDRSGTWQDSVLKQWDHYLSICDAKLCPTQFPSLFMHLITLKVFSNLGGSVIILGRQEGLCTIVALPITWCVRSRADWPCSINFLPSTLVVATK